LAKETLETIITRASLKQASTSRTFFRGAQYAEDGRVRDLVRKGDGITADVLGTEQYHVSLGVDGEVIDFDCDCPVGLNGEFCKHCVAVGLAWLEGGCGLVPLGTEKEGMTIDDVRSYLNTLTSGELIELIIEQADKNSALFEELLLCAARLSKSGIDIQTFREAIDRIIPNDYLDEDSTYEFSEKIGRVLNSLEDLINDGHGESAAELLEYAIPLFNDSYELIDDMSDHVGSEFGRLPELYLRACEAAQPEPAALAEKLFDWAMTTEYIDFSHAAKTFAGVLGEAGLAAFRTLVEDEWETMPALAPGSDAPRYGSRSRLTSLMEGIARGNGDVDFLVTVKSRDLSNAFAFFEIAELYKKAERYDDALAWAERGLAAFPDRPDNLRLRDFLIEEYYRRGRYDEEIAIVWQIFTESPILSGYQFLESHASRINQWSHWRERAWSVLQEASNSLRGGRPSWISPVTEIVKVLLWERRTDEAWNAATDEATGNISAELWLQLADQRAASHPEDALRIYDQQIHQIVEKTTNGDYDTPMELLERCRIIQVRLNHNAEFQQYVGSLYAEFRRKRNFIKRIDAAKWS